MAEDRNADTPADPDEDVAEDDDRDAEERELDSRIDPGAHASRPLGVLLVFALVLAAFVFFLGRSGLATSMGALIGAVVHAPNLGR